MDKETLSNYGWVVVVLIVLALMISLATPFTSMIRANVKDSTKHLMGDASNAIDNITKYESFDGLNNENNDNGLPMGGEVYATGEILDSWDVIINNVNNGTYATKYAVGNYKALDLGSEGVVNMQIAAFDADVLSDGSGNAHITWIAKELLATKRTMNDPVSSENGWAASDMRTYLSNDVWALIPVEVQSAIVEVDKTYFDYTTQSTLTCSDKVWIPSLREVRLGTFAEDSGVIYSGLFTDNSSRIKTWNGEIAHWWLRTARPAYDKIFYNVVASGSSGDNTSFYSFGVALSFCM